jgi:hypothetical protein
MEGMANTPESAVLSAAAEAVNWRHAGEADGPRKGVRSIIFPKEPPQLEAVLSANDPNIDPVDGHSIAYEAILQGRQHFENPPVLLKIDSESIRSNPMMFGQVPEWMASARQVAVGSKRRVLENGDDKMNSSDEDDENMVADKLTGMYTSEMDPKTGPIKLTSVQVALQRATAQALKEHTAIARESSPPTIESERQATPLTSPVNSDDEAGPRISVGMR